MSHSLPLEHLIDAQEAVDASGSDLLRPLLQAPAPRASVAPQGLIVGELIAMTDDGRTPLVLYPGQPGSAAIKARTVVDLHGAQIGRPVALMFENADPQKPIVMGVLREGAGWPLPQRPAPGRGRRRRQPAGDRGAGAASPALRKGQHYPDQVRQGADSGRLRVEPLDRRQSRQGWFGAAQLTVGKGNRSHRDRYRRAPWS